jgi:uncharacterized peroxidase-related enzyme
MPTLGPEVVRGAPAEAGRRDEPTSPGAETSMPNIRPPALHDLPADVAEELRHLEAERGYVPHARLTLAHRPETMRALNRLADTVMRDGTVDPGLKYLVAVVSSMAAGCTACQANASFGAHRTGGVDPERIEAVWTFEQSPLFTEAERAALRFARDAAQQPSAATPAHFDDLRAHFDEGELVELMSVICLFGWNNRWNDSVGTTLEDGPVSFAEAHLAGSGWSIGKHERSGAPHRR